MLRYRIDVRTTNEGGVSALPVEHREGPWFAANDVIDHVTMLQVAINNQRIMGHGENVAMTVIEEWLDKFGVTVNTVKGVSR